jgi:hypothetical protein
MNTRPVWIWAIVAAASVLFVATELLPQEHVLRHVRCDQGGRSLMAGDRVDR